MNKFLIITSTCEWRLNRCTKPLLKKALIMKPLPTLPSQQSSRVEIHFICQKPNSIRSSNWIPLWAKPPLNPKKTIHFTYHKSVRLMLPDGQSWIKQLEANRSYTRKEGNLWLKTIENIPQKIWEMLFKNKLAKQITFLLAPRKDRAD